MRLNVSTGYFNLGGIAYNTTKAVPAVPTPPESQEPTVDELEGLYISYVDQRQNVSKLCEGVWYLGYFVGFGEIWARQQVHQLKARGYAKAQWPRSLVRSQAFQERALDATLADLKDCVILSTTPTYFSQYQNACLLKSRGFQLLEDSCQLHPGYKAATSKERCHPGIPDRHEHYEHVWWKVQGPSGPKNIGSPADSVGLNNCGVDGRAGLAAIKAHDAGERKSYLTVGWLPRGTPFPNGWKRFYSAEDYKLGHNFEARGTVRKLLTDVQKCPHNFDLNIFKDWMPDFSKGVLS
jgi:hypothetical protein